MLVGIDYILVYLVSALDPRVFFHMIESLPVSAQILLALIFLRYHAINIIVWITWIVAPGVWQQPVFRPSNGFPLVSVIIPSRNQGHRLDSAVRSILAAGWPNLEVIVADDYSTDNSWKFPKEFERTGRVRVMGCPRHGGKTTALNLAITSSQGDYILVMDAQNQMEPGALRKAMGVMTSDHRIGAVTVNFRVISGDVSFVTTWQEWDYPQVTMQRMLRSKLGLMNIISGGCGLFRREALQSVGFYDPGLGDDTDITLRLRKQGWKLRYCHEAIVSTDPPHTFMALIRQRQRWKRNMVKIRIHKHWDLLLPWRYGWVNSLFMADFFLNNVLLLLLGWLALIWLWATNPFAGVVLLGPAYFFSVGLGWLNGLLIRDFFGMPRWVTFLYVPFYFLITIPLHCFIFFAFVLEALRIGAAHPYVPKYLWRASPRW